MPLIAIDGGTGSDKPTQPLLVFADGDRIMGLMVDEIIDVVEDRLDIELAGAAPGLLGTAVIGGAATDVLDTGYWLTQAWQDWFRGVPRQGGAADQQHVLVVEDSDFFRQLLVPTLGAAGYRSPPSPARPRRCGCATPARCSTPSSPTSRCRTWTGCSSPAPSAPAAPGRTCR